jgi:hypothetical protein
MGRKIDPKLHAAIVKDLTLARGELSRERTKHYNPGDKLQEIADKYGVSRKTVDRINGIKLTEMGGVSTQSKQAKFEGVAAALSDSLDERAQKNLKRNREQQRRSLTDKPR